jgi:translocation and assembly module TamB
VRAHGTLAVADEPAFDLTASWTGFRWPLDGEALFTSPRGELRAEGWTEFGYRVSGDFVPAAGPPFSGEAAGRFTADATVVDEADLRVAGGRVMLKGSLGRGDAAAWSVSGRATGIDPSRLRPELPGRLAFDFAGSGTGFGEDGPWSASVHRLSGMFRGQRASGGGGIRRSKGQLELQDVSFALGPARLQANGVLGRAAKLDARIVSDDLSAILPELGGQVDATVSVREHTVAIAFTGHDLAYGAHRAVVLSADAHIDRDGREHSWLRLRSNGITLAGLPISDTRLSLDGLPKEHSLTFRVGVGEDAVALRGRGAFADGRYTLALDSLDASGPRLVPWRLQAASRLSISRADAALDPFCIAYETRRICLEGRWRSGGDWSARATTEAFPLEALSAERLGAPRFRGLLVVDANAAGHAGEPWTADVRAEIRDAALDYRSASGADRTVALGLTRLTLVSDAERHRLELRVSDAADLDLVVAAEAARIPGAAIGDLPLTGSIKGRTRQLSLLPLLVDAIDSASGDLALDFSIAGKVAAPVLEGEARLAQGTLDFYQTNLRLRELQSTVRLGETSLTFDAKGKAGDGTLAVEGRFGWKDRRPSGALSLTGDRLLVANVPEARVLASPDLKFTLDDHRIDVSGEVAIPEARIQPADTAGAVLTSSDERVVEGAGAAGGTPFEVLSDVRLALGDKVSVKAYGLSATVTGAVRTRTAPRESTTASGELEVKEGEYSAYGRELEVERGRLLFTGGPVTDPGVDLRATRELPGYKVGVIARGPLRRPQLTLFSEPSLPQSQIASMLIVGRSSVQGEPGAAKESSLSTTEEGGAFLAGQLGKYVGLDDIGVTQDSETGAEVVLGKYLSPRLYVSYGISLVEQINTLKLRYTIGDRWTVSAESGLEQAVDIEYRIED